MSSNWFRKRWFDFRLGHSVYLIFLLSFSNFILIFHRLLIERIEFLDGIFSELWMFIVLFVVVYVPISIGFGAWHRKTQLKVETEVTLLQNPLYAKMFRTMLDIQTGDITKEEIKEMKDLLRKIESGKGQ